MRTRTKKLATLGVLRAELESLLLKAQGVEPLWQARWAERRANEAKFQLALTRAFRELTKLLGTPRELVKLGKEAWQGATKEQAQERVKVKLLEKLAGIVEEFTHAADDAVSEAVELATKSTLSNYGLVRKQLSVREIHSELNVQLTEMVSKQLEQSFGVYANDLASTIVKATDPAKPLSMPELAKQLQSQVNGLTRKRAMLIARTESARAFGHTTYEWYKAAGFSRYRWATAAGSPAATISPVCQFCQALAAQALREIERGFEATLMVGVREPKQVTISARYPPFHPNCFVRGTRVLTPGVVAGFARWYVGQVVRIQTVGGRELTVTPNHPVLTGRGWVEAGQLNESDYLVSCGDRERNMVAGENDRYGPALVEHVLEAFVSTNRVTATAVPVTRKDFHGDGIDGQIAVVWADRLLGNRRFSESYQTLSETLLVYRTETADGLSCDSSATVSFERIMGTSSSVVSCKCEGSSLLGGTLSHEELVRLLASTEHYPVSLQGEHQALAASEPVAAANSIQRLAGDVILDKVSEVRSEFYSGYVYNLQTTTGVIIANGIVTQNCRCDIIADTKDWLPPRELFGPEAATVAPLGSESVGMDFIPEFKAPEGTILPTYETAVKAWSHAVNTKLFRAAADDLLKDPTLLTAETMKNYHYRYVTPLLNKLRTDARSFDVLYRGMQVSDEVFDALKAMWRPGSEVEIGLSSFTRDPEIAREFAGPHYEPGRIIIRLRNARGLDISDFSDYADEKEVITIGRLRIVDVEEEGTTLNVIAEWLGGGTR